jgi:hypothetical protein
MLYDLTADAYKVMNRANQEDRFREVARQRLISEALAGRQERETRSLPSLGGWRRKLAKQESGIG